jgi:hypothetical protein
MEAFKTEALMKSSEVTERRREGQEHRQECLCHGMWEDRVL